jgi:amino acid adenylation domain-containing protein
MTIQIDSVQHKHEDFSWAAETMNKDARSRGLSLSSGRIVPYPRVTVHQLFAEQVALRPEAEAVVFGTERLTYSELDQRSNQVAQFLVSRGICAEDRVGIFMNRCADLIVAMLGILKAGGAYTPIDPDYPAERLKFIAEDTSVKYVFSKSDVTAALPTTAPIVYVDGADSPIRDCSTEPVPNRVSPESIAVVIYTSGSTGKPKAARIPHRAVIRTVRNTNYVQIAPDDRIAQAGSPSFDAAIKEIWLALVNGATLVGVPKGTLLGPAEFKRLVQAERINILVINTTYVHQMALDAPDVFSGVRRVLFGGETANPTLLRPLLKYMAPGALVNCYGPAEGCVITSFHEITDIAEDATTVPIGRPVNNTQVYLLDEARRPVPIGVEGEIYVGGEGVARGYLNRPDLTAQRFLPDTFTGKPDRLLYRTGDLGLMRSNGEIEFRGRADEQVKIRGHRIELAEVRQAIAAHPEVTQVFLMVREDQPGDKRLVAYVTLRHQMGAAQDSLLRHAKDKLPAHMRPAAFVVLSELPLNTNGKVDRKALPPPNDRPEFGNGYRPPSTEVESKLTRIWRELLRVNQIGVDDNFFDLGGHSLLAARLIGRIEKEMGYNIPVATLFEAPTIAELAHCLSVGKYTRAWSPVVELRATKEKTTTPPFFCAHSLGANLVSFHKLASFLKGDRTIYGLQPQGLNGEEAPAETVEAMAAGYLAEIRKAQPHGPYFLGGVCIGGVLAYEIAQQLKASGEEVALVMLIDSFLPGELQYLHTPPALTEYLDSHLGEMLLASGLGRVKFMGNWLCNGAVRVGRALGLKDNSSLAKATERVGQAHRRAINAYRAKPYSGKVVQVLCSDAFHRANQDRRLAWSALTPDGLEIRIVPGNHLTMMEEPHIQLLAQQLQECLDRAPGGTISERHDTGLCAA